MDILQLTLFLMPSIYYSRHLFPPSFFILCYYCFTMPEVVFTCYCSLFFSCNAILSTVLVHTLTKTDFLYSHFHSLIKSLSRRKYQERFRGFLNRQSFSFTKFIYLWLYSHSAIFIFLFYFCVSPFKNMFCFLYNISRRLTAISLFHG